MKKWLIFIVLLAAIATGFYVWHTHQSDRLPEYLARSNGRLELARYDVATLYAGRVEALLVDEGSEVKAGDVLARLSTDTSSQRVAEAQAGQAQADGAILRARATEIQAREAMARAQAQIAAQQQQLKVAQMELDNAIRLQRENLVSDAEVQRRRAQRDGAAAAVKAAQAARGEAQAAVSQTQAAVKEAQAGQARAQALLKTAETANDDMQIVSPKTGRVAYRLTEEGSVIGAGSKVVSLLDPNDVSMNIFLPLQQVAKLKVGDEARIVLDGVDGVLPATISFIATDAQFTPKAVETESERAKLMFKVKLQVPPETAAQLNRLLKGGMAGNGYVRLNTQQDWGEQWAVKLPQ